VGISETKAKTVLIALVYGATFSQQPEHAIPTEIGIEKAQRLYLHPDFLALRDDVSGARSAILKGHPRSRQTIKNLRGLTMNVKNADDKQLLAHLLQGVEAVALEAAHRMHPDSIVLLQHDGFTSTSELDCSALELAIQQVTGYRLEVSGKKVLPMPDESMDEHPVKNQNAISENPNADNDLHHFSITPC
jgi:hypothetical protein